MGGVKERSIAKTILKQQNGAIDGKSLKLHNFSGANAKFNCSVELISLLRIDKLSSKSRCCNRKLYILKLCVSIVCA